MNPAVFAGVLLALALIAGCTQTGAVVQPATAADSPGPAAPAPGAAASREGPVLPPAAAARAPPEPVAITATIPADPCHGVRCAKQSKTCPDGTDVQCKNKCIPASGECTLCEPDCTGHEARPLLPEPARDPCAGVACLANNITCPDGFLATCPNTCAAGACTSCQPDCAGHDTCQPDWACGEWGPCTGGNQTRTCTDQQACGGDSPPTVRPCTVPKLVLSEVFYDTPGNDAHEEWAEIYNPSNETVNLSTYALGDNSKNWSFPATATIAPYAFLTIARNATAFGVLFNCSPGLAGLTLSLGNTGDQLFLVGPSLDMVAWEDFQLGWNLTASTGTSIRRADATVDTDSPADWLSNQQPEPSCG